MGKKEGSQNTKYQHCPKSTENFSPLLEVCFPMSGIEQENNER